MEAIRRLLTVTTQKWRQFGGCVPRGRALLPTRTVRGATRSSAGPFVHTSDGLVCAQAGRHARPRHASKHVLPLFM